MVGVCSPRVNKAEVGESLLRGLHHFGRSAVGSLQFADRLLRKDAANRSSGNSQSFGMPANGIAEPIAKSKGGFQAKRLWAWRDAQANPPFRFATPDVAAASRTRIKLCGSGIAVASYSLCQSCNSDDSTGPQEGLFANVVLVANALATPMLPAYPAAVRA